MAKLKLTTVEKDAINNALSVAAEKFDAVEMYENDLLFFDGAPRQVRSMIDDLGLKIALFHSLTGKGGGWASSGTPAHGVFFLSSRYRAFQGCAHL